MTQELKFSLRFDADNKQFVNEVKKASGEIGALDSATQKTSRSMRDMEQSTDALDRTSASLKRQLTSLTAGFAGLLSVNAMLGVYNTQAQLIDQTAKHASTLGLTTEALSQFRYMSELTGVGSSNLDTAIQRMTRRIAEAEAGTGEAKVALEALGVEIDELQGMTPEQMLYRLADSFSTVRSQSDRVRIAFKLFDTEGVKMVNLLGSGSAAMMQMAQESDRLGYTLSGQTAKSIEDTNDAMFRMSAVADSLKREFAAGLAPVMRDVADGMVSLSEHGEVIATVFGVTVSVGIGRASAALTQATAAKVADIAASRAQQQALIQTTQQQLAATSAEIAHLQVMKTSNNQKFRAIGAESQLTAAQARREVLTNRLTAAQTRLNVVSRAGSAIMATLGGPLGVAMMAAGALAYFAVSASSATDKTQVLKDEIDGLVGRFGEMNEAGRANLMTNLGNEASIARQQLLQTQLRIQEVKKELEFTPPSIAGTLEAELVSLERDAANLSNAVDTANQKFQALFNAQTDGNWQGLSEGDDDEGGSGAGDKANSSAETLLANLQRQVALYGQTSHAAKLRYDIEHGSLKGINDELAKSLMLEAQRLDKLDADSKPRDTSAIDAFYEESDQINGAWQQRLAMQADMEQQAKIQEQYAYTERQASLSESFQLAYEQALGNQELMDALEREYFANRELLHAEHEMNLTDIAKAAEDERSQYQYQVAMNTLSFTQQQLDITTNFLKQAGEEQSGVYRALFAMQKLAAIPSMIIATEEAAVKALTLGPIAGPIASGAVRAMGYASVGIVAGQALAGQAHDGIDRVPRSNEGTWMLKANEMVLNPTQADNFRWMVDVMQQMKTVQAATATAAYGASRSGGMPVTVNVTGVDRSQVTATAEQTDNGLMIDLIIEQAVAASMDAMYQDADNGGPVSQRINKG